MIANTIEINSIIQTKGYKLSILSEVSMYQ